MFWRPHVLLIVFQGAFGVLYYTFILIIVDILSIMIHEREDVLGLFA